MDFTTVKKFCSIANIAWILEITCFKLALRAPFLPFDWSLGQTESRPVISEDGTPGGYLSYHITPGEYTGAEAVEEEKGWFAAAAFLVVQVQPPDVDKPAVGICQFMRRNSSGKLGGRHQQTASK